ncbi:hypothetical protein ACIQVO_37805 [Streptomyces sp. NPDC101062]|uniref:hypothetical protein n=1 Tax=unclassified Streptomyces TaxID=2593676 RepID=UPI00381F5FD9
MSEVTDLLTALRTGSMTLEQVAGRFRRLHWRHPAPRQGRALADPEPPLADSFEEVVMAYSRHELTDEQYEALLYAAANGAESKPG